MPWQRALSTTQDAKDFPKAASKPRPPVEPHDFGQTENPSGDGRILSPGDGPRDRRPGFIQHNVHPYEGDEAFLTTPSERTRCVG